MNNKGEHVWIVISVVVALVIALAGGIVVLRSTHAIWDMTSQNAVTMNNTLNAAPSLESFLVVIVIIGLILLFISTMCGFKET